LHPVLGYQVAAGLLPQAVSLTLPSQAQIKQSQVIPGRFVFGVPGQDFFETLLRLRPLALQIIGETKIIGQSPGFRMAAQGFLVKLPGAGVISQGLIIAGQSVQQLEVVRMARIRLFQFLEGQVPPAH
jgi:hypothetical protein